MPPQSWEAEEIVRNLGPGARRRSRTYFHLIDDIVDIVPIGATGESPGNIARAIRYGAEWKGTVNFDRRAGAARGSTPASRSRTRVDDPLTGEPRRISNSLMHLVELTLRHDVPETDWAWGSGMSYALAARDYRLTEVGRLWEGPVWAYLYVEHKDVLGLTVRATVNNILGADSLWDRTVYVGRRTGRSPSARIATASSARSSRSRSGEGSERLHGKERSHENPSHGHGACPSAGCAGGGADGRLGLKVHGSRSRARSICVERCPVRCGRLRVPENYDVPGRSIEIAAMIISPRHAMDPENPVIFLHGGPGGTGWRLRRDWPQLQSFARRSSTEIGCFSTKGGPADRVRRFIAHQVRTTSPG